MRFSKTFVTQAFNRRRVHVFCKPSMSVKVSDGDKEFIALYMPEYMKSAKKCSGKISCIFHEYFFQSVVEKISNTQF